MKLRVSDPKRKKVQSFSEAAAETFGSAASSTSKQTAGLAGRSGDRHTADAPAGQARGRKQRYLRL